MLRISRISTSPSPFTSASWHGVCVGVLVTVEVGDAAGIGIGRGVAGCTVAAGLGVADGIGIGRGAAGRTVIVGLGVGEAVRVALGAAVGVIVSVGVEVADGV